MSRLLRPVSWPIAVRMACDLLAVAIVPLLIASWLMGNRSREALATEARENLALLAKVTATRLDQLFVDAQRSLEQLAGDDRIIAFAAATSTSADGVAPSALLPMVMARVALAARSNPDFAFVMLLDEAGTVIATTEPSTAGQNYSSREYFRAAADGRAYLSELLVGRTTNRPGVFCSAPVRDDDRVVGVVVLKLQGERVWEIVDAAAPDSTSQAMITDKHGVILAHSDRARLYHSLEALPPATIAAIDAMASFARPTIEVAPMPGLVDALTRRRDSGALDVDLPAIDGEDERFAAGFAPLAERSWMVSVLQPHREFVAPLDALARQQSLVLLVIALLTAAYALIRARGIVRPVVALTHAAERVSAGDFTAVVPVRGDDELAHLGRAFNAMVPRLHEQLELRRALDLAMDVQQALLPAKDPELDGLEVAGRSTYCDETGGDYYDFIDVATVAPNSLVVALGDVSGHGVASALLMASARAALRAAVVEGADLAGLLTRVNRVLSTDARHGRFMTMVVARIDGSAGIVRWASAGHDPIIIYDAENDSFVEREGGDLPLGIAADVTYEEYACDELGPGAILLLGTDGIWESRNAAGQMFGKDRLRELMRAHSGSSVRELAKAIDAALTSFREGVRAHDDVTYVLIRFIAPRRRSDAAVAGGIASSTR